MQTSNRDILIFCKKKTHGRQQERSREIRKKSKHQDPLPAEKANAQHINNLKTNAQGLRTKAHESHPKFLEDPAKSRTPLSKMMNSNRHGWGYGVAIFRALSFSLTLSLSLYIYIYAGRAVWGPLFLKNVAVRGPPKSRFGAHACFAL